MRILSKFPSFRYLSSSGSYPLYLYGLGDPVGCNATAGLSLRVAGTHKPLHPVKLEISSEEFMGYLLLLLLLLLLLNYN
jgi:hypothetical protein